MKVHAEFRDGHQLVPLCREQGESHTMSRDKRLIDCPKCLQKINTTCSWCKGVGSFSEWGEISKCGQCDGTGYAYPEYHDKEGR